MPDLGASVDPGFAPAKLNLALHVVGQRADGYHELESLVVFASVGDRLDVTDGDGTDHLTVSGRFAAGVPVDGSNIVLKAVTRLREAGAARVVICGATVNHCVETTTRMAGNLGFDARLAEDVQAMTLANLSGEFATIVTTKTVVRELSPRSA